MNNLRFIEDLLHIHGLKNTAIRSEILELFIKHDFALTASNILKELKSSHDRVTVYRALSSFEERGILHKASEDGQGTRYALCGHSCTDGIHEDNHAHFVCDECNNTYCMEEVKVPKIEVSNGYSVSKKSYTLSGVCKKCND